MSARKVVLSRKTHYHQIPQAIRNSLPRIQTYPTHWTPPFVAKPPPFLATNLIKSYFEKGQTREARLLFDEMPDKDVVAWTSMIVGYNSCNLHFRAWNVFCEVMTDHRGGLELKPNEYTLSSATKACRGMGSIFCGTLVHGLAMKYGMLGCMYVDNALLDLYATHCITMDDAWSIFEEIDVKNAVSWTTMIAGYTHRGDGYGGLIVFKQMLSEEAESNPFSFSIAIRACASIGSSVYGKQFHAVVVKDGFESNVPVMNSVLDMYCRCGSLMEANQCFDGMIEKDLITWNTLVARHEKSNPHESLNLYSRMELEGFSPNCYTFTSVVAAVANLAVLSCGEQVHGGILRRGLQGNVELANALIDMYAKCGSIVNSRNIFNEMSHKNLVSWTSMMTGYGSHGYGKEAIDLFDKMVKSGIRPDRIVFVAVLGACSHAGLIDEGLRYFSSMVEDYNIAPDQEMYGCVVDLLGRAGRVNEAYGLIESMPFLPDESVWGAFLGACKAHKLPKLGKLAVRKVLELTPNIAGTYVVLSNLYAADGKWGEFARMRKLMRKMGRKKEAGKSWIEVKNEIYSFVAGDKMGSHIDWVYGVLGMLAPHMREAGYVPDLDCLIHDSEDGT